MDFRQFFDGFFKLNEELGSFFDEALLNKDVFFGSVGDSQQQNLSPRDMMLKKPESAHLRESPAIVTREPGEHLFQSKSFVQTFNADNNGHFQEKIVIRDGDGTEKIITKHSTGGRTTHKEVRRKGNQILSEKEVVSDIGDDLEQIGFDHSKDGNFSGQKNNDSFKFWKWF